MLQANVKIDNEFRSLAAPLPSFRFQDSKSDLDLKPVVSTRSTNSIIQSPEHGFLWEIASCTLHNESTSPKTHRKRQLRCSALTPHILCVPSSSNFATSALHTTQPTVQTFAPPSLLILFSLKSKIKEYKFATFLRVFDTNKFATFLHVVDMDGHLLVKLDSETSLSWHAHTGQYTQSTRAAAAHKLTRKRISTRKHTFTKTPLNMCDAPA